MKLTYKVPPSSTEQTITIDVPDTAIAPVQTVAIDYGNIQPVITGTTPIQVTPDPIPPTPVPVDGYKLLWQDDFKTSDSINKNIRDTDQAGRGGWQIFDGKGCFRSEFRAGDPSNHGGWRSELQYKDADTPSEGCVEYSVWYEKLFLSQGHSFQWHPNTDGASSALSMWHSGGKFQVVRQVDTKNRVNIYGSATKAIQGQHWYKMRIEYRFTTGSDGYIRWYIDGELYYTATGKTADGSGQYMKLGQNLFSSQTALAYYTGLKVYQKI